MAQFKHTITYDDIQATIDRQWESRGIKMDWLAFEEIIRDIVESAATNKDFAKEDVLYLLNDALEAFTGRGRAV